MVIIGPRSELGGGQLRKYSASSSNGRHTLTITLEYDAADFMDWDVRKLDEILQADKTAAVAEKADRRASSRKSSKQLTKTVQLALPAPDGR